jgi:hypothetical protein
MNGEVPSPPTLETLERIKQAGSWIELCLELTALRKRLGFSRRTIAEAAGLSYSVIERIEAPSYNKRNIESGEPYGSGENISAYCAQLGGNC